VPIAGVEITPDRMSATAFCVLGTPLQIRTYASLTAELQARARQPGPFAVDFTNTHIVTLRRREPEFRELTGRMDYFIPDGMPLIWCLNRQGAGLRDRVYGPTFMRECILATPAPVTHYFLGGNDECVTRLQEFFRKQDPEIKIIGARNGYFKPKDETLIADEINRLSPDFIWIGLGTPKQQAWIHKYKSRIDRGILLAVGFAFDVNAGMKPDAPLWMQRLGLTWVHRLASEPLRLGPRYVRHNFWFLFYLFWDGLRGRAWKCPPESRRC
jgi:N-acetylglucosaminyldiphosphoundecaprenol N-acetyl-beta-D-mannosaminyltransferase